MYIVQTNKKKEKVSPFFCKTSVILYRCNEFHVYNADEQQNATQAVSLYEYV